MIIHFVLIRLKPDIDAPAADHFLKEAKNALSPIPTVQNLHIGKGMGVKADVDYPFSLVMEFEDELSLNAYQVHPEHQRFAKEILGPICEDKKIFDYVS